MNGVRAHFRVMITLSNTSPYSFAFKTLKKKNRAAYIILFIAEPVRWVGPGISRIPFGIMLWLFSLWRTALTEFIMFGCKCCIGVIRMVWLIATE